MTTQPGVAQVLHVPGRDWLTHVSLASLGATLLYVHLCTEAFKMQLALRTCCWYFLRVPPACCTVC